MASLQDIKTSNGQINENTIPRVAVFIGATAGIGRATLSLLVSQNFPIKVYVIGRNEEKHKPFLEKLRSCNKKGDIIWLEGQVSLLAETKRLCDEIKARERSIDLLFMSAGFLPFGGRHETSEGIEMAMATMYYCRMHFTICLLPLLNASLGNPRVISILSGGTESSSLFLDDLDLKALGHFGIPGFVKASSTYTTLSMSRLARDNPRVVFVHNHPGVVSTDILQRGWGKKWYGRMFMKIMHPIVGLFGISVEESGERTVYLITSAKYGGKGVPLAREQKPGLTMAKTEAGALFDVNDKLECVQQETVMKSLRTQDAEELVWVKLQEVIKPYL